jgi:hypothetical protein
MTTVYKGNGNGGNGATTPIPPTTKVITGASLAHRQLDARQRAILVADVLDGLTVFTPSQKQFADIFGVSVPYIMAARKLSPGKRAAILRGWDSTSFAELVNPVRQLQLKLPAPNCASITNLQLEHVIRAAGLDRTLEVAAEIEQRT